MVIKGKTKSGFKYSVNSAIKTDFDFVEAVEDLQNGDASIKTVKKVIELLLGTDGFLALKEHIKKQNEGIADLNKIVVEFQEIASNPELKN